MTARVRATAEKASTDTPELAVVEHRNEVIVAGRLATAAVPKQLPSGDEIVSWRLIVDRPSSGGARKVDVVDCTAFGARVRRQALGWDPGEVIEITGALRRRFWRGAGGLQSRCEVEVVKASRPKPGTTGRRAVAAVSRPRKPG